MLSNLPFRLRTDRVGVSMAYSLNTLSTRRD